MENIAGNHYDKYKSKNPIERQLVRGFFDNVARLFDIVKKDCEPDRILEAGSEVLEHLEKPDNALKELKRIASGYLFLSVPQEPVWRLLNMCRFKYWTDFGNTPGHIQHFSRRGFLDLIREVGGLEVVAYRKSLPWQMVLLRKER